MLPKFCGGDLLTIANWYSGLDEDGNSGSEKPGLKYLMHYQNLAKTVCEVQVDESNSKAFALNNQNEGVIAYWMKNWKLIIEQILDESIRDKVFIS